MIETTTRRWPPVVTVISVLIVVEAVSFLVASLLHAGVQFPLGIAEPRNEAAAIVEGLCGIFLAASAIVVFARAAWAWGVAVAAHVFSIAGVLLGIAAVSRGGAPGDEANAIYHPIILVVLIVTLILLVTRGARTALGRRGRALQKE
ncbi:MAG TPA: hypothetical protein VNE61_06735, partial [Ktedonobacteraceae bacterium]|nr:hypothetical protein [Ktedonobacteraceae bacterium]